MAITNKKEKKMTADGRDDARHYAAMAEWLHDFAAFFHGRLASIARSQAVLIAAAIVVLMMVLIYYPSRADDYDIYYHLKFGEHFVQNRTFQLDHSMFSWTPADPAWRYGIWLGSSALYLAHKWLGGPGLYLIQWLIFVAIVFTYLRFTRLIGDSFDMSSLLALALVFVALNLTAIYIKPELFTTLFFTIAVFIFFYTKYTKKSLFLIYPLLLLLWVNTHGGYLTGLAFISIALTGELCNHFFFKKEALPPHLLKHLAAAVVTSYIAVLFNPYGLDYHIGIIKSIITEEYMGYATQVFAWVGMWKYLLPRDGDFPFRFVHTAWALVLMAASFGLLSIYLFVKKRFLDITIVLLMGFFFYEGMKAARVTLFVPLLWLFSMPYIMKRAGSLDLKKRFAPFSLVLLAFLSAYIIHQSAVVLEDRSWFGSNLMKYAPVKEVEFVKRHNLPGPIFNDYLIGGYLIWDLYPEHKVFIDPRYGPYWKEAGPDYFKLIKDPSKENIGRFKQKYAFNICVFSMRDRNLIVAFLNTQEWNILYFDKSAVVLVHRSVIPSLGREVLATDMSTARFKDVTNPAVLDHLFNFYLYLGPAHAREIVRIFRENVSPFWIYKEPKIQEMQNLIAQREGQLGAGSR